MKNQRSFLLCDICGNITAVIESSGVKMVCCGKEMAILASNTTDEGEEKHVPQARREDGILAVEIGAVPHPMTQKHYISWIAVAQENSTQIINLKHDEKPCAQFPIKSSGATIYAYCNIHGLWASEVEVAIEKMVCSAEFAEGCKKT